MLGDNDIIASIDGRKNKATFDGGIKKKHLSSLQQHRQQLQARTRNNRNIA